MDNIRTTQNSGVMVPRSHSDEELDFFGRLVSVVQVGFMFGYKVLLFQCEWFNTESSMRKKSITLLVCSYHLTLVNTTSLWYNDDPYILETKAQ